MLVAAAAEVVAVDIHFGVLHRIVKLTAGTTAAMGEVLRIRATVDVVNTEVEMVGGAFIDFCISALANRASASEAH
jgi:hypothetical protein